jgi:hypothetical protein
LVSYGTALEEAGRTEDADDQYLKAIKVGGPANWVDLAKTRRTELAQNVLRKRGGDLRPDVMMYITGSLERFSKMNAGEIKAVGMEIAMFRSTRCLSLRLADHRKRVKKRLWDPTFKSMG